MRIAAKLHFNHFDKIAAKLPQEAARIVEDSARHIEGDAKIRVPVDTGNLQGAITSDPVRPDKLTWLVHTGDVEYAEFVEYGVRSKPNYPIQPYMTPAAEAERPHFVREMTELEEALR